jgi:hypothetical protein
MGPGVSVADLGLSFKQVEGLFADEPVCRYCRKNMLFVGLILMVFAGTVNQCPEFSAWLERDDRLGRNLDGLTCPRIATWPSWLLLQ